MGGGWEKRKLEGVFVELSKIPEEEDDALQLFGSISFLTT